MTLPYVTDGGTSLSRRRVKDNAPPRATVSSDSIVTVNEISSFSSSKRKKRSKASAPKTTRITKEDVGAAYASKRGVKSLNLATKV